MEQRRYESLLKVGAVLGERYRLERLITEGNLGPIYEAADLGPREEEDGPERVVVKVLGPGIGFPGELLQWMPKGTWKLLQGQLRSSVRLVRKVDHLSICRVLDLGFIDEPLPPLPVEAAPAAEEPAAAGAQGQPPEPGEEAEEPEPGTEGLPGDPAPDSEDSLAEFLSPQAEAAARGQAATALPAAPPGPGPPEEAGEEPDAPAEPPPGPPAEPEPPPDPDPERMQAAYLVMPYLEGQDLLAHIQQYGSMSLEEAMGLFIPLLEGLDQVHRQRVLHGELRPENLMVVPAGDGEGQRRLMTTDISGRRIMQLITEEARRVCPLVPGPARRDVLRRARYISPEGARGLPLESTNDVYQLALTYAEAVSGRPAVRGESVLELEGQVMRFGPVLPEMIEDRGPLAAVIRLAIHRDPTRRQRSTSELAADLQKLLAGEAPRGGTGPQRRPEQEQKGSGGNQTLTYAIFLAGAVLPWLVSGWTRPVLGLVVLALWLFVVRPTWLGLAPFYLTAALAVNLLAQVALTLFK